MKEKLNDLDGKVWTRYSISVWDIVKTQREMSLKHPAMFPIELVQRLIEIYTHRDDTVLDPFAGSGSVMIAAMRLDRMAIGIEINRDYINLIQQRLIFGTESSRQPRIYHDDARNLLRHVKENSIDLVITSPPYWITHQRRRTADYKNSRPYSKSERDLGNILEYTDFLNALKDIFGEVKTVLKSGQHCIIIAMDIRVGSNFIPFHIDIISMMKENKFKLEDIIIWNRNKEYNNLRPLGYPYQFIVNKVHEYIMIFKNE